MLHSHACATDDAVALASLDGEEILFDPVHQKIYALSRNAGAAWRGWRKEGSRGAESALASLGVPPAQAAAQASTLIEEWNDLGLLRSDPGKANSGEALRKPTTTLPLPESAGSFAAANTAFAIACPDACSTAVVEGLLGAMGVKANRVDFAFTVDIDGAGYALHGPARTLVVPNADALAVALKNEVLEVILDRAPQMIALHAAALMGPKGAILLAGTSGSGKTTLAVTLHAHGLSLIADDVALLDERRGALTGLPFAFALKPGSWPILAPSFPGLMDLPPRTRPDGKIVRYLPPASTANEARVSHILFPKFTPGAPLTIEKAPKRAALVHLLSEARNGARSLSAAGFNALCQSIQGAETLTLSYDRADAAADAILRGLDARY